MVKTFLLICFGFIFGTFIEYWLHRALHKFFPVYHQQHHDDPKDYSVGGSWQAHLSYIALGAVVISFFSLWMALGFLIWYGIYVCVHYYCHHLPAIKATWVDPFQDNHIVHHNENDFNYGVTSPVWDLAFMTYKKGANRND